MDENLNLGKIKLPRFIYVAYRGAGVMNWGVLKKLMLIIYFYIFSIYLLIFFFPEKILYILL